MPKENLKTSPTNTVVLPPLRTTDDHTVLVSPTFSLQLANYYSIPRFWHLIRFGMRLKTWCFFIMFCVPWGINILKFLNLFGIICWNNYILSHFGYVFSNNTTVWTGMICPAFYRSPAVVWKSCHLYTHPGICAHILPFVHTSCHLYTHSDICFCLQVLPFFLQILAGCWYKFRNIVFHY